MNGEAEASASLRQRAEASDLERSGPSPDELRALSAEAANRAIHELRVHQIELELQNEELRRTQEDLAASRASYFDLYDLAPVGYCTVSEHGLLVRANLAAATLLGMPRGALIGQRISRFIARADHDAYYERRGLLLRFDPEGPDPGAAVQSCELRMVRAGGTQFWAHLVLSAARVEGSRVFHVVLADISERKGQEEALRSSEERYRAITDAAADAIITAGEDGIITGWNPAAARMFGYPADRAIGRSVSIVVPPESADGHDAGMKRFRRDGPRTIMGTLVELTARRGDGTEFPVELSLSEGQTPAGHFSTAIIRDLTERRYAEAATATLEARLQQAQKMELVGRLAGGVAHDFNNMLAVILGNVELALGQVDAAQPVHADLLEVQQAGRRSADLTRQLLTFARKTKVAPKALNLNETLHHLLPMIRRLVGEQIQITWSPGLDLWLVKVDASQVEQVLVNLCLNARDAIADAGTITIGTANSAVDSSFCLGNVDAAPGEYVLVSVSDTGAGMPESVRDHVFEPFFTTKAVGEGTGLGLATVYGSVRQSNGFVAVTSDPGEGARFDVYLPRYTGPAESATSAVAFPEAPRGSETILLVEDEAAILRLAARALEAQGYRVLAAAGPAEALRLAEEHSDGIRLLVSDVIMPGMNGPDLAARLRRSHPDLRCVFMSGHAADVIPGSVLQRVGTPFVQKPFTMHDLAAKVREVLDRSPRPGRASGGPTG